MELLEGSAGVRIRVRIENAADTPVTELAYLRSADLDDGEGNALTREDYVSKGMAKYDRSWERKLLLGIYIILTWVQMPVVLISYSTGDCVEVLHGDYDCDSLPDRYSIEFSK